MDRSEIIQRFGFHKGTPETIPLHADTRAGFIQLATFITLATAPSREQSLALTALQEAAMWTNCAIAMTAPLVDSMVDSVPPPTLPLFDTSPPVEYHGKHRPDIEGTTHAR
jgi:hypothetical protein